MARKSRPKERRPKEPLPPALPHETRPIGQVIAEAIRLYGRRFWPSLALGIGPALTAVGLTFIPGWWDLAFVVTVGSTLMTVSYIGGVLLAADRKVNRERIVAAFLAGFLLLVPAVFLYSVLILPAVVWLGLFGLAVPAALLEGLKPFAAIRRGFELARADLVHAIGSMATLVIVSFLTATVLYVLLLGASEIARSSAAFLSLVFISPLLFLGAGLLYFDQEARVRSAPRTRRPDADVHHADEPDRPGRADAEGKPRPAAGGQP
jgi:hypothetical protein